MKLSTRKRSFLLVASDVLHFLLLTSLAARPLSLDSSASEWRSTIMVSIVRKYALVSRTEARSSSARSWGSEDQRVTWDVRDRRGQLSSAGTITSDGTHAWDERCGRGTDRRRRHERRGSESSATARVAVPEETPAFPEQSFKGADAGDIATVDLGFHDRRAIEDDAVRLRGWLDESFASRRTKFGRRRHAAEWPVVDVFLHTQESPLGKSGSGDADHRIGKATGSMRRRTSLPAWSSDARDRGDDDRRASGREPRLPASACPRKVSTLFLEALAAEARGMAGVRRPLVGKATRSISACTARPNTREA